VRESLGVVKPKGGMKVKAFFGRLTEDVWFLLRNGMTRPHSGGVSSAYAREAHRERTRWDPKDGELCLGRTKPEETLVEVRFDSDVQIDRRTLV
jgi:hypothetical protein